MAANLLSVVMQFLTPDTIQTIASHFGLDRSVAQKAINGAVPALLASVSSATASPNGVRRLTNLLQEQSGSIESLKGLISGSARSNLAETGSSMLSGFLGSGTLDGLGQSIGKFAGIGNSSGKSIVAMLGPVVLGALARHQRDAGLDASGLVSLLHSQKDEFATAIPSGLADQLSAAGIADKIGGGLRSGAVAASAAGDRIASASERAVAGASRAAHATTSRATSQWPYWIIGLAILGGLAWYFLARPGGEKVAEAPPAIQTTGPATGTVGMAPPDMTVGTMNLESQVNSSVDTLRSVLPGITDVASAQAALPKIREVTAQLNEVGTHATKLSPEGKSALGKLITAAKPTINQMCDKVLAIPGVEDVAKPAIDELRGKLDTLSQV